MEIERKYLVNMAMWLEIRNPANSIFIQQAYLSSDPANSVRIRITDKNAFLTIKGATRGISRQEFEYPIPVQDGLEMLRMAGKSVILKRRYEIMHAGFKWEVDEFYGENEGLVMAEVELKSESDNPEWPEWIDKEVTGDPRYYNLRLAENPINTWQ
jgi:adenylate cyclase